MAGARKQVPKETPPPRVGGWPGISRPVLGCVAVAAAVPARAQPPRCGRWGRWEGTAACRGPGPDAPTLGGAGRGRGLCPAWPLDFPACLSLPFLSLFTAHPSPRPPWVHHAPPALPRPPTPGPLGPLGQLIKDTSSGGSRVRGPAAGEVGVEPSGRLPPAHWTPGRNQKPTYQVQPASFAYLHMNEGGPGVLLRHFQGAGARVRGEAKPPTAVPLCSRGGVPGPPRMPGTFTNGSGPGGVLSPPPGHSQAWNPIRAKLPEKLRKTLVLPPRYPQHPPPLD